jgi:hypothetical protein
VDPEAAGFLAGSVVNLVPPGILQHRRHLGRHVGERLLRGALVGGSLAEVAAGVGVVLGLEHTAVGGMPNHGRSSLEVEPESLLRLYSPGGFCLSCSCFFSSGVCAFFRWRSGGGAGFVSAGGVRGCALG